MGRKIGDRGCSEDILVNVKGSVRECIELHSTFVGCNISMIRFKFNWIIYDLSEKMKLCEYIWTLRSWVKDVKGIESLPQTQIFLSVCTCNLMV